MKSLKNDNDPMVSWKSILAYLKSNRKGRLSHGIEKNALDDPFLSDAIEGFEEFGDEAETSKNLKEIEKYIAYRRSQERESNSSGKRILAIAASFAVLISASLWVWFSLFNEIQSETVVDIPQVSETEQSEEIPEEAELESIIDDLEEDNEVEITNEHVSSNDFENEEKALKSEPQEKKVEIEETKIEIPKSSASPRITTSYESKSKVISKESEIDNLIKRILAMEKEFLGSQNVMAMALNDLPSVLMDEEGADLALENFDPQKNKSQRKKAKENRSMASGAASSSVPAELKTPKMESSDDQKANSDLIIDSLILGIGVELNDSITNNSENHLLIGINKLYQKDTSKAVEQLKLAIPRSSSQRVLIDSLLQQLNP